MQRCASNIQEDTLIRHIQENVRYFALLHSIHFLAFVTERCNICVEITKHHFLRVDRFGVWTSPGISVPECKKRHIDFPGHVR